MKLVSLSLLIALGASAGIANAECNRPAAPGEFPDGATAPREEMVSAFNAVSQYNEQMTAYLECIKAEHEVAMRAKEKEGSGLKNAEQREAHVRELKAFDQEFTKLHDAAYDELVGVVARFDVEKNEYNARVKKEKEAKKE